MVYYAHLDKRDAVAQLKDGWLIGYHAGMQRFYTYDPANRDETFGSRGLSKAQVRNLVKKGVLEQIGQLGEIFKIKEHHDQ